VQGLRSRPNQYAGGNKWGAKREGMWDSHTDWPVFFEIFFQIISIQKQEKKIQKKWRNPEGLALRRFISAQSFEISLIDLDSWDFFEIQLKDDFYFEAIAEKEKSNNKYTKKKRNESTLIALDFLFTRFAKQKV